MMHCHTVVGAVRASAGRQRAPPPPGQKKIVRVRTGCAEFFKKFSLVRKAGRTEEEDAVFFRLLDRRESSISASFS